MLTDGRVLVTERLVSLERTIDSLNGQLREVRWELGHAKVEPLPVRLWRNLVGSKSEREYMSTVCNRNVRPNTKIVSLGEASAYWRSGYGRACWRACAMRGTVGLMRGD